jgi:hypothetical protein
MLTVMQPRVLLVNPPVFDFSAYDFWVRPFGLLRVAGWLRGRASLRLFDFLDRLHPDAPPQQRSTPDRWGRGGFHAEDVPKPAVFATLRRRYRRFGLPAALFRAFLAAGRPFHFALIQTTMTYWYPGVREVIKEIRALSPETRIVLGGVYATLCPSHARSLGADLVVEGAGLASLWAILGVEPALREPPLWEAYESLKVGVLKLTEGCPSRCNYCSVPRLSPRFTARPLDRSLAELDLLRSRGVEHIAFYDDALLFRAEEVLVPFLKRVLERKPGISFHTPNGLHARWVTRELASLLVRAGFQTFFLGFESVSPGWQRRSGKNLDAETLARAVDHLVAAGADARNITAYLLLGHPDAALQDLEGSMEYAHRLGIRVMLSEFSPIPGTPDFEPCRRWVDLDEPLNHNKTAFPAAVLGEAEVNHLKNRCKELNRLITSPGSPFPRI